MAPRGDIRGILQRAGYCTCSTPVSFSQGFHQIVGINTTIIITIIIVIKPRGLYAAAKLPCHLIYSWAGWGERGRGWGGRASRRTETITCLEWDKCSNIHTCRPPVSHTHTHMCVCARARTPGNPQACNSWGWVCQRNTGEFSWDYKEEHCVAFSHSSR